MLAASNLQRLPPIFTSAHYDCPRSKYSTLLGTNISHPKAFLKMIFLFAKWDMKKEILEGIWGISAHKAPGLARERTQFAAFRVQWAARSWFLVFVLIDFFHTVTVGIFSTLALGEGLCRGGKNSRQSQRLFFQPSRDYKKVEKTNLLR